MLIRQFRTDCRGFQRCDARQDTLTCTKAGVSSQRGTAERA